MPKLSNILMFETKNSDQQKRCSSEENIIAIINTARPAIKNPELVIPIVHNIPAKIMYTIFFFINPLAFDNPSKLFLPLRLYFIGLL